METTKYVPYTPHMRYSLNSRKGAILGSIIVRVINGDTRSLDYSPYNPITLNPKP